MAFLTIVSHGYSLFHPRALHEKGLLVRVDSLTTNSNEHSQPTVLIHSTPSHPLKSASPNMGAKLIPLGSLSPNTNISSYCSHQSAFAPGQLFCSSNCDKCPKWGAKECLFGRNKYKITTCDNCAKYGAPGCAFNDLDKDNTIVPLVKENEIRKCQ